MKAIKGRYEWYAGVKQAKHVDGCWGPLVRTRASISLKAVLPPIPTKAHRSLPTNIIHQILFISNQHYHHVSKIHFKFTILLSTWQLFISLMYH